MSFYDYYNPICSFSDEHLNKYPSWSFEAFIVKWADEIAQRHHDVEDALRCGLLTQERICEYIEKGIERCKEKERVGDSKSIEDICNLIEKFNQLKKTSDRQSFMKVLSSLVVDTYVSCFIDVFQKTMQEISKKGITTRKEFIDNYLTLNEKEINKALLDCYRNNPISVFDEFFGKRINKIILQSFSVQRQDGKGNYIIRKLVKAYLTNPQQLPDQAIEQIFKRELPRYFITDDYNAFFGDINISKTNLPRKTSTWTLIDCRNVLQLSWKNQTLLDIIYPLVFRAIFDYISNMTDSFALKEYSELYG